jgi:hypothetical protein
VVRNFCKFFYNAPLCYKYQGTFWPVHSKKKKLVILLFFLSFTFCNFWNQQKVLGFYTHHEGIWEEKKNLWPLLCCRTFLRPNADTCGRSKTFFFAFSFVLHQNETTGGCQAFWFQYQLTLLYNVLVHDEKKVLMKVKLNTKKVNTVTKQKSLSVDI